ncbi:MAG: hypothetical protein DLM62_20205 [Pseudonocardiales bacterium]|nr:MAG: hypothetical protein DLM62_20205 [Pseudonocardiales bacterium]
MWAIGCSRCHHTFTDHVGRPRSRSDDGDQPGGSEVVTLVDAASGSVSHRRAQPGAAVWSAVAVSLPTAVAAQ